MSTALPRSLETLDYKALSALEVQITAAKAMRYQEAQSKLQTMNAQLQERLLAAAKALGVALHDAPAVNGKTIAHKPVVHKSVQTKGKSKVAPKYRNPDNKTETWSGRGRQPRWMVAKIKAIGGSADQFKI